jgi:hypothetical protein
MDADIRPATASPCALSNVASIRLVTDELPLWCAPEEDKSAIFRVEILAWRTAMLADKQIEISTRIAWDAIAFIVWLNFSLQTSSIVASN